MSNLEVKLYTFFESPYPDLLLFIAAPQQFGFPEVRPIKWDIQI